MTCEVGRSRVARHDRIRNWEANAEKSCRGIRPETEQRVPQWDRVNPRTNLLERAVLDVATRSPSTGELVYLDVRVACELSADPERMRARARRDGAAASAGAADKRLRYPEGRAPGALVPFVVECGGRPSDEAAAWMRALGAAASETDASISTATLWQQLATELQLGNAEMILSAIGPEALAFLA